jgi:hypothetical protein
VPGQLLISTESGRKCNKWRMAFLGRPVVDFRSRRPGKAILRMSQLGPRAVHVFTASARAARIVLWFPLALSTATVFADAGAVRASQRQGSLQIAVFTDPTPLRAGPVDVSVLVQDAGTGDPLLDDVIDIEVKPRDGSSAPMSYRATRAAASNKLFQAANFELPHAGWWTFNVQVGAAQSEHRISFDLEAGDPLPAWRSLWLWFCWPFFAVAAFAALLRRGRRGS